MMRLVTSALALLFIIGCQSVPKGQLITATTETVDGVPIVYDTRGDGDTTLVFVHCWSCDRGFWHNQLDTFADKYRVVSLDLPGHGESGDNREEWSVHQLGADVAALVEELDLRRVILIGHSMGGPVSLVAAPLIEDRVIGVVAVDTLHNAEFEYPPSEANRIADKFEQNFEGTMAAMMPHMLPNDADPAIMEWITQRAVTASRPAVAVALMRDAPNWKVKRAISAVRVPIRAINAVPWGANRGFPTAVETNRRYADYDAMLMDGVGHYPMLERPDEFNTRLAVYLAWIDANSR